MAFGVTQSPMASAFGGVGVEGTSFAEPEMPGESPAIWEDIWYPNSGQSVASSAVEGDRCIVGESATVCYNCKLLLIIPLSQICHIFVHWQYHRCI